MRNLIAFISKYSFFFFFLLFELLAFYLLFKNNGFQRSSFLNSTNTVSGELYGQYSELTDYVHLKEVNEALSRENQFLREHQLSSYERLFGQNYLIKDTVYHKKYLFTQAKVINNSVNRQNNFLTLNIGSRNGIESGMGVIGPQGVVGVIKNVSENFSSVLSLLNSEAKISVKLKKSNYFGSLEWSGEDYLMANVKDIPNHVRIQKGDTLVTSGFSSTFPEGIVTSVVTDFSKPEGENFYSIQVKLINDFKQLSYVYVIKNNRAMEQEQLEQETLEEND